MVDAHLRRIFLLSFTLGLTTLAFIIAKTGRDALFFQGSATAAHLHLYCRRVAAARHDLRKSDENLGSASGARRNLVDCGNGNGCRGTVFTTRRQYAALDHVYVH